MSSKMVIWIAMFVGSSIGSFIPEIWGANVFSASSIFLGGVGAVAGIWLGFKMTH